MSSSEERVCRWRLELAGSVDGGKLLSVADVVRRQRSCTYGCSSHQKRLALEVCESAACDGYRGFVRTRTSLRLQIRLVSPWNPAPPPLLETGLSLLFALAKYQRETNVVVCSGFSGLGLEYFRWRDGEMFVHWVWMDIGQGSGF